MRGVLREESVLRCKDDQALAARVEEMSERLARCEENKEKMKEGVCKKLKLLEKEVTELHERVVLLEETAEEMGKQAEMEYEDVANVGVAGAVDAAAGFKNSTTGSTAEVQFCRGAYVTVQGVKSREALNGVMGLLREWHEIRGRWAVELKTGEHVLLKENNLVLTNPYG